MPKHPKGMFKRKGSPSWYIRIHRGGRDRWISLGTDFQEACREAMRLKSGVETIVASRTAVRAIADKWLEYYVPTARNEHGVATAKQRVRDYLDPFMGHMLMSSVNGDDVRAYRQWLEKNSSLSPASIGHLLSDLRCLLNWAVDSGIIERNPFPRRVMPRLQERPPDRLSDEEAEALKALPDPHGFVCRLALGTGLRWAELCRAQASDVKGEFLVVHQTKSGKLRRVPLAPELLQEIRGHVGRLVPFARRSPGSFAQAIRRATGIEGFHVHQMRHTFACQWVERGGNLAALQQILGHASIETTQRYARLMDDAVMREARRINEGERSA